MTDHGVTTAETLQSGQESDTPCPSGRSDGSVYPCSGRFSTTLANSTILRRGWFDPSRAQSRFTCIAPCFEGLANARDHLETTPQGPA